MPIDPILSLVVAGLITRSAVAVIRESGHVLLEGTPENVDAAEMRDRLATEVPEVEDVHHIHIWSLTDDRPVVTLHAAVAEGVDPDAVLGKLHGALVRLYGVSHATIQIEQAGCIDEVATPPNSRSEPIS